MRRLITLHHWKAARLAMAFRGVFLFLAFAVFLTVSCGTSGQRIEGRFKNGEEIVRMVKVKLMDEGILSGLDMNVRVSDRHVTLTGDVDSLRQKEKAGEIASGVKGVSGVTNLLVVRRNETSSSGVPRGRTDATPGERPGAQE